MANVGDIVRFLNDVGGGRVLRIDGNFAWVDNDGFETPVLLRECVVVRTAQEEAAVKKVVEATPTKAAVSPQQTSHIAPSALVSPQSVDYELDLEEDFEEIEGGDVLNITIGFEPTDRTRLSQSDFDASLVNDSNYFLYFTLLSKERESDKWTTRYAGMVEPNTELWLGTYPHELIGSFDNLCLQYIAFKRGREFDVKSPTAIAIKVDTTKFAKLHCFRSNPYFDNDVLAFTFVEEDEAVNAKYPTSAQIKNLMLSGSETPKATDVPNQNKSKADSVGHGEPLIVDLHIDSLVDNKRGMSRADMLNLQIDTFRKVMDENLKNYGRKIVFIHGKGEGVLRQAIYKELNHRYRGHDAQDASFAEFGHGATQVTIRQHPDKFVKQRRK